MLKVGCAGFPVGRDRYWRTLSFVEAATGLALPQEKTLEGWKAEAPAGAEFALQAYRLITHGPADSGFPPAGKRLPKARQLQCGGFRESLEVHEAWQATKAAAETLGARLIVFETPSSFLPGPDRSRDLYRFFKSAPRGRFQYVWQPWGWDADLVERVCAELGLIPACDPLKQRPSERTKLRYLRPRGPRVGALTVDNLSTIRRAADDGPSYLALAHRMAFHDAQRLL